MIDIIPERLPGDGFFLRRWEVEDAAWYVRSRDEEIFQWTTEKRGLTIAETETAIRQVNAGREAVCFAIADPATGGLLGNIALTFDPDQINTAEIMYWLAADARGRGIATRAVILLSDWAFQSLGLDRIILKTLRGNLRSQRVAERAGFRQMETVEADYIWFERCRREGAGG